MLRSLVHVCLFVACGCAMATDHWVDAWAAVPDSTDEPLPAQTVRQVIRPSIDGRAVQIQLSNLYGDAPLLVGSVHLARHAEGAAIAGGSDHRVTFGGKPAITLAKGEARWSDPVRMKVSPGDALAVSFYLPEPIHAPTIHGVAMATGYALPGKDAAAAIRLDGAKTFDTRLLLTGLRVDAPRPERVLVVLGDSITDGVGSTPDRNLRWPDQLASRVQAAGQADIAVVAAGIAGNRILRPGRDPFVGPSALARLDRDVLDRPGVRWMVLLEGINDIAASDIVKQPDEAASADEIIHGMQTLITRAHARQVKVIGATLLPLGGATFPPYSEAGEAKRQAVNQWIRTAGGFDSVVDFDAVLRDPVQPNRLRPAYDSGDHCHPNDAGYKAMADAVDLQGLRERVNVTMR